MYLPGVAGTAEVATLVDKVITFIEVLILVGTVDEVDALEGSSFWYNRWGELQLDIIL